MIFAIYQGDSMIGVHKDQVNADLLAFIKGEKLTAA